MASKEFIVEAMQGTFKASEGLKQKGELIRCKDCKYFVLDYFAKNIPVIIAHEVCTKWGNHKTSLDGYCFLAEKQRGSGKGRE